MKHARRSRHIVSVLGFGQIFSNSFRIERGAVSLKDFTAVVLLSSRWVPRRRVFLSQAAPLPCLGSRSTVRPHRVFFCTANSSRFASNRLSRSTQGGPVASPRVLNLDSCFFPTSQHCLFLSLDSLAVAVEWLRRAKSRIAGLWFLRFLVVRFSVRVLLSSGRFFVSGQLPPGVTDLGRCAPLGHRHVQSFRAFSVFALSSDVTLRPLVSSPLPHLGCCGRPHFPEEQNSGSCFNFAAAIFSESDSSLVLFGFAPCSTASLGLSTTGFCVLWIWVDFGI
jgi:hypothetical protein